MKAIILCAGFGSRLGSLGRDNPKALLDIVGRPLINWTLDQVIELDFIKSIYVVHNTLFEPKFQNWHKSYKHKDRVRLINNGISEESSRRGAVADIAKTVDKQSIFEPVVVFPGDTVFTFNVKKFFYEVKRRPELGWLSLRVEKNEKKRRSYGVVGLNNDGVVTSFNEKPAESTDDYVYKGPCYFPPTVTSKLNSYCSGLKEEGTLPDNIGSFISWAINRIKIKGCVMHSGECIDVGSFSDYRSASQRIKRNLEDDHGEGSMF